MTVTLEPMPADRRTPWLDRSRSEYIESRQKAGETLGQATANADRSFKTYFPHGVPAAGQHVFDVVADGEPVGVLWIGVMDSASNDWWVFDVEISESQRGRGYGRAAMQLAETTAQELGAASIGLNVFGYNTIARHLYESLGYETTSVQMKKGL